MCICTVSVPQFSLRCATAKQFCILCPKDIKSHISQTFHHLNLKQNQLKNKSKIWKQYFRPSFTNWQYTSCFILTFMNIWPPPGIRRRLSNSSSYFGWWFVSLCFSLQWDFQPLSRNNFSPHSQTKLQAIT